MSVSHTPSPEPAMVQWTTKARPSLPAQGRATQNCVSGEVSLYTSGSMNLCVASIEYCRQISPRGRGGGQRLVYTCHLLASMGATLPSCLKGTPSRFSTGFRHEIRACTDLQS